MGKISYPVAQSTEDAYLSGRGIVTQTFRQSLAVNAQLLTGGTAYGVLFPSKVGQVISNALVQITTAGSGVSLFKVGIYSKDAVTRYATGAGTNANYNSAGTPPCPIAWTNTVANDDYLAIIVATAATTLPTLARASAQTGGLVATPGAFEYCTAGTGLSDVPAAGATLASSNAAAIWICFT